MEFFNVSEEWKSAFPGAAAGILAINGVANPERHAVLDSLKADLESRLRDRYAHLDRAELAALPNIRAYNDYYKRFKKTFHVQLQLESLILKGKPIPSVAALVEAMFMAELENLLLTAGHDLEAIDAPIHLDIARGDESYILLRDQEQVLKAGDMLMADRQGIISSVLYGPDLRTRITPQTSRALFAVYAPAGIGEQAVLQHLHSIQSYVRVIAPDSSVISLEVYGAP